MEENEQKLVDLLNARNDPNNRYYVPKEEFVVEQVQGTGGLKKVDNIYIPMWVTNLSLSKTMTVKSDDVFVIGYPKSGTTWLEEIVWLIVNDLNFDESRAKFHYFERVMFLDDGVSDAELRDMKSPRVIKSHFTRNFLPDNLHNRARVVYILRNPKDVVCSLYEFARSYINEDRFEGAFEQLVNLFLDGKYYYGPWWEHVDNYADLANVHFIHYESLLKNTFDEIKRLSKFLGKSLSDEQVSKIVAFSSFESMKTIKSMDYFQHLNSMKIYKTGSKFFVKGKCGYWRNYFSDELSAKLDRIIQEKLKYKRRAIDYGEQNSK